MVGVIVIIKRAIEPATFDAAAQDATTLENAGNVVHRIQIVQVN